MGGLLSSQLQVQEAVIQLAEDAARAHPWVSDRRREPLLAGTRHFTVTLGKNPENAW